MKPIDRPLDPPGGGFGGGQNPPDDEDDSVKEGQKGDVPGNVVPKDIIVDVNIEGDPADAVEIDVDVDVDLDLVVNVPGLGPVVVSYDRGDGRQPAEYALPTGKYLIGLDPETGLWDVFVAADVA
jgi:hypothetical protein